MILATSRAAGEVGSEARELGVGVGARYLNLDVLVEEVEALLAGDLGLGWAEDSVERVVGVACHGHPLLSG